MLNNKVKYFSIYSFIFIVYFLKEMIIFFKSKLVLLLFIKFSFNDRLFNLLSNKINLDSFEVVLLKLCIF